MKAVIINSIIFLTLVLFLNSCDVVDSNDITGSGNLVTLEKDYSDFTVIKTGFAFESTITKDSEYSVIVTIDDNLEKHLKMYQLSDILYIQLDDNNYIDAEMKVDITMPDIEKVDLSGASTGIISGFNLTHDMEIILSGASNFEGSLSAENLFIALSGASNVLLTGSAQDLSINGSGASVINLGSFQLSGDADVKLSGASVTFINLNGKLDANLSGESVLNYYGEPTLGTIILTGASTIQPMM